MEYTANYYYGIGTQHPHRVRLSVEPDLAVLIDNYLTSPGECACVGDDTGHDAAAILKHAEELGYWGYIAFTDTKTTANIFCWFDTMCDQYTTFKRVMALLSHEQGHWFFGSAVPAEESELAALQFEVAIAAGIELAEQVIYVSPDFPSAGAALRALADAYDKGEDIVGDLFNITLSLDKERRRGGF